MRLAEQRAMPGRIEMRADTDNELTLTGYATVFNSRYVVHDFLGEYSEAIRDGAFTKTLAENDDVRLLLNHAGLPLARTKSGTLDLAQDNIGLRVEARLDAASSLVADIRSAMDRGDMDQMSFAFRVIRQEWNEDYTERDITEAQLFDVSVVTFPANPATSADIRSALLARQGSKQVQKLAGQVRRGDLDQEARATLLNVLGEPVADDSRVDDDAVARAGAFRAALFAARNK